MGTTSHDRGYPLHPAQAEATLRELFARFADTPTLVIGGHSGAGRLQRDGGAFRPVA